MIPQVRGERPARRGRWAVLLGLTLALVPSFGCGREFFREWANQDVSEAVFEKSRDPRWRLDMFTIEAPALARYADPYDTDFPPAPPDDRATEALSPVPQWPHHRLMTPVEGTGYLDMLEAWRRSAQSGSANPPPAPNPAFEATPAPAPPGAATGPAVPAPPSSDSRGPFAPLPNNSGPPGEGMTPPSLEGPPSSTPSFREGTPDAGPIPVRSTTFQPRDSGVRRTAFQPPEAVPPALGPAETEVAPPERLPSPVPMEPNPRTEGEPNLSAPVEILPGVPPGEERVIEEETAELSGILTPGSTTFDEAEAAGLPPNSRPYIVDPEQAFRLALINNRAYQYRLENIYLASLAVTLQRFSFEPQFFAGNSPITSTSVGLIQPNPVNSFLYRTAEAPGGQASTLSLGTVAGFGKLFGNGIRALGGYANQTVFNFVGVKPSQPTVQSTLPLTIFIPFLRGGGRAVIMESLTLAERNLLYEIRNFVRFRQEFFPSILTSGLPVENPGLSDPTIGYLNILQQVQAVENDRRNIAAFERYLVVFPELAEDPTGGITQQQIDQIDQNLQNARLQLVNDITLYRSLLDQFKVQMGLPPDVPLILDRGLTESFREVFDRIDVWTSQKDHKIEDLPRFLDDLPEFEEIFIDGRPVLGKIADEDPEVVAEDEAHLEDLLLAAERVALENRVDLMNARAQLYDAWRQLAVTANALRAVFNVSMTSDIFTPPTTSNPFGFNDQSKQFSLVLNTELPLIRVAERNNYMTAHVQYNRQRRALMFLEDSIKYSVRQEVRTLRQLRQSYEIQKRRFVLTLRTRDQTIVQLVAPPAATGGGGSQGAVQVINLVNFQNQIPNFQNTLVDTWVLYETQRLSLYRDLGIMPYDEWEAYYELVPPTSSATHRRPAPGGPGPAASAGPTRPPQAHPPQAVWTDLHSGWPGRGGAGPGRLSPAA